MEDQIAYQLESVGRTITVFADPNFLNEVNSNNLLKPLVTKLIADKVIADNWALKLNTSSAAHTEASEAIRDLGATNFSIVAQTMNTVGIVNNIDELIGFDRFTFSELRQGIITTQLFNSNKILQGISNHQQECAAAKIDALVYAGLQVLYGQMQQLTSIPQNIIDQHKNDKKEFKLHLKNMHDDLIKKIDGAMSIYKLTFLSFYLAYTAARKVRHHHLKRKPPVTDPETTTGILETMVLAKDTMDPQPGVKLVVTAQNIVETTDEDGETYNDMLAPGTYQRKLIMEGYKDIDFEFTIEAGKTTTLQFMMEKE